MSIEAKAMFAQVAVSQGDAVTAYRLVNERQLDVPKSIELLAQSSAYKTILPQALGAYTKHGEELGETIASFPEFDQRTIVAREITEVIENGTLDPEVVVSNLDGLGGKLRGIKKNNYLTHVALQYGLRGEHDIVDRMLQIVPIDQFGNIHLLSALKDAVDVYDREVTPSIVDEIFGTAEDLKDDEGGV
ncbi:MAG: hypothetical protein KKG75_05215 [Nanoarchaeota archaeon]|nr:hypothetical protein [Nanoarchaeota archaeon]